MPFKPFEKILITDDFIDKCPCYIAKLIKMIKVVKVVKGLISAEDNLLLLLFDLLDLFD